MHGRSHRLVVRHKVWLDAGGRFVLGDGGFALLEAVAVTGSVRAAARRVGWSYRHALGYLTSAERGVGSPLVRRVRGGAARGGAVLTAEGRDLVRRFRTFRRRVERTVDRLFRSAFGEGRR